MLRVCASCRFHSASSNRMHAGRIHSGRAVAGISGMHKNGIVTLKEAKAEYRKAVQNAIIPCRFERSYAGIPVKEQFLPSVTASILF